MTVCPLSILKLLPPFRLVEDSVLADPDDVPGEGESAARPLKRWECLNCGHKFDSKAKVTSHAR